MGASNLPEKDELEIQMQKRIAELEKANQDLRAENMALNRDITKHKRAEEESGQNEQHFGLKLENNLSTSRKAENLELAEIIDIQAVQSIIDDFYKFAHITMALLDLKGNVLIGVGWQDICTKFHRVHPETCKHCVESDTKLSAGVPPGEFKLYRCKNNMWDIVTPIIVDGHHIGNIFSGQFFFDDEPVDYELFRTQARKYGFNEEKYIAALEKVPRLSRETVENSMSFFMKLANMLSQLSHSNIKLAQSLEERNTLVDDLDRAQAVGNVGSWRLNAHKNELTWSDENHRIFGIPKGTPLTYETFLSTVHPDDREYVNKEWEEGLKGKPYDIEHRIIVDGKIKWVREKAYLELDKDGAVVNGFGITQDITERRQAEHQLSNELARATGLYELYTRSSNLSDRELYDFALNQAVKVTDSMIGFFHLVSEDEKEIILTTWNQEALRSCTAGNEGHYPIEKAGNWVDCVRLKRPVVYNDFPSSPNQKGLPAGHAAVKRFMSVPVIENGKVRIIFGVGNKVDEYDDRDVMQLQLVANELHKIMKLRRIENEVRESEAFLRDIMENVSDAIFVKDREARMILANPAYYRLIGKSPEEVLNKTVADFHPPEIARKLAEGDKRVMEAGKGTTLEERIFTSHGWRILQTVKAPYYDGQGNIIGLIGAARDITERRQAEEALKKAHDSLEKLVEERTAELEKSYNSLKESEKSLSEAQKIAHIGNWDWNLITGKIWWSNELYRIFGLNPQELPPAYGEFLNYIHPEDRCYVDESVKQALNGKSYSIDNRIVLDNGENRVIHVQAEVVIDDKNTPIRIKGTTQDITERKKAEEKIRILADAVESSNDAIVTESLDGNITSWNKTAEDIYGYSAEETLGKNVSILEPESVKGEINKIIERVKQGEKIQHYKTLRQKKDGTIINVSITYSPVFDASGKLMAISAIARDITEQINAERLLAKAEEARKKEIHHRIKNNLQVISSLLDLQAEKFRSRGSAEDLEVLNAFRESQDRVMSIAFIHKELHEGRGTDKLNFSPYLKRLVENLFQTYKLGNLDISLNLDVEENIFFDTDIAVPLGMIINELVSNSLKYAFPDKRTGEIQIKLFSEEAISEPDTRGELFKKGKRYTLIISDNGIGIPKEINLENTETLGVQLVNILVEQLDGQVELKRDNGTEFVISFGAE
ncbi:hypothetical protein MSHOH_2462 [Methanosarcina horonobensis HB-1 = JCM 15518]|uniref:Sensory transduction histidine kinase n=1 Tax=Methanosarcina horonobensis HB-1 = JCM 15518 TaxID=1434110 RepID=A0A0E3WU88_9EURY|nr:PAS domain S-box protein [Methanosarcina horonobensis]AKB78945.1 hypothetical protein MSHOH_2462 [Methanosarcina horonobensis HB-1 = JCM 15518]